MKQNERFSAPTVGGTSLLVIFSVLCLTVFALLCLSTAQAEKRIADASLEGIAAYYEADRQAQEIYAQLRGGEIPAEVMCEDDIYSYSVPISKYQRLEIELYCSGGVWHVERWQAVVLEDEDAEDTLEFWDGMMEVLP